MANASACRILEWDTEFFGLRIATLGEARPSSREMDAAIEWCRAQSVDCLYLLSDVGDSETHRVAEEHAFHLVDVRITLATSVPNAASALHGGATRASDANAPGTAGAALDTQRRGALAPGIELIRTSTPADVEPLREIAAASHVDTRFFVDGRFDRAKCADMYATWIEKSCRGWADVVFVAELDGVAVGYLSCHMKPDATGNIGLVGIAARAQGRGLGRRLVEAALEWFASRRAERATVVTQGRNVAAQRIYQACGFRTASVQLWHHRWFDASPKKRP